MPLAEVADRLTINLLKLVREPDNVVLLKDVKLQLAEAMEAKIKPEHLVDLLAANARVWELESEIRQGKEGSLGVAEVGRRALKIREHNGERITAKNLIASEAGQSQEIKIQHLSANGHGHGHQPAWELCRR